MCDWLLIFVYMFSLKGEERKDRQGLYTFTQVMYHERPGDEEEKRFFFLFKIKNSRDQCHQRVAQALLLLFFGVSKVLYSKIAVMMMMMTVGSLLLPAVPFFFFLIIKPTTLKKIYRHILSFCAVPKKRGWGIVRSFFFFPATEIYAACISMFGQQRNSSMALL